MSLVIRISPMSSRVVLKRTGLTAQAAGCLRCKVYSLGSVPFKFVCLFVVVVIVCLFFSNFSAKNISSRLIRGILLSQTILSVTVLKEIQWLLNKVYFIPKSNTFVTASFSLADMSFSINCKFQSLRQQSRVVSLCRDSTWVRN